MKESYWGYVLIFVGTLAIVIMMIIRDYQTANDNDYYIMKEVLQDAMIDSVDYAFWRENNDLRIIEEKFVENYLRRFAHSMASNKNYKIEIFDVNEQPPKASVKVTTATGNYIVMESEGAVDFGVVTMMSGILDSKDPENAGYVADITTYNITVRVINGEIAETEKSQDVPKGSTVKITTTPNNKMSYESFSCTGDATKYVNDGVLNLRNIKSNISCTIVYSSKCKYAKDEVVLNQDYTGEEKTFFAPCDGYYKIEAWGAAGSGNAVGSSRGSTGGLGGYSVGVVELKQDEFLFLNVGGKGKTGAGRNRFGGQVGGYNGGGNAGSKLGGSGGGATHVATRPGLLNTLSGKQSSVLIVAGGGGGTDYAATTTGTAGSVDDGSGGNGGGYKGGNAMIEGELSANTGATQRGGASFGKGADCTENTDTGGGGGGWYGGKATNHYNGGGGGGSGYIASEKLLSTSDITKHMFCYNCGASSRSADKRTTSGTCSNISPVADCAKQGNGYIRITYIGDADDITIAENIGSSCSEYEEEEEILKEGYTGSEKTFELACDGIYKLEAWGAQGVGNSEFYIGGKGGYTVGKINAVAGTTLYINVGGKGTNYNGGHETSGCCHLGSGGASSIATSSGQISALSSNKGSILIVAGGGGGGGAGGSGGAGGGGNNAGVAGSAGGYGGGGSGGTLTAGGAATWGGNGISGTFGVGGTNTSGERSGGSMGGGGYFGGGPGGSDWSGYNDNDDGAGGGGSGYANTAKLFDIDGKIGEKSDNGKVVITYLGE